MAVVPGLGELPVAGAGGMVVLEVLVVVVVVDDDGEEAGKGAGVFVGAAGVPPAAGIGVEEIILSEPIGANGLGLPVFWSGISMILESCRERNALSEKIESSSLIFFIFKSVARKSWVICGA